MNQKQQREVGLGEFVGIIARRWRLVAYTALTGMVLAAGFALLQPPSYRAVAVVQVEAEKPRFVLNPERQANLEPLLGVAAEIEIVRSRLVLEPVIRELGLETNVLEVDAESESGEEVRVLLTEYRPPDPAETAEYTVVLGKDGHYKAFDGDDGPLGSGVLGKKFQAGALGWQLDVFGAKPGTKIRFETVPFETALDVLRGNLMVDEVGKQTNIISIAADMPGPQQAKRVAERITQEYIAQNVARKSQEVGQILSLIEQQLQVVRGDMERDEKELNDLKSAKGVFVLSEAAKRILEQIGKMEMSRAETQLEYKQVVDLAHRLKTSKDATSFLLGEATIKDELITELSRELTKRLVEVRSLRQDFTAQNPRVVTLNAEIDELKARIGAALDNVARSLKSKMETAESLVAKYEGELRALPQAERELAALTRKTMVTGELYSFLLQKHEEMRIAQAGIVGNLRVVEQPVTPMLPVAPKKMRIAALGLLAGIILGLGLTFLAESMDDTIKATDALEQAYQLPVFGEIPLVEKTVPGEPLLLQNAPETLLLDESFNTLATNLRFAGTRGELKRIVFASGDAGEGKTTCLINLGITLANRGARVLLIDCDLRRPTLHRMLGLREQPGLTQVLVTGNPWREALVRSRKAKLDVLAAGAIPPNQAELLDGERFARILSETAEAYDYVLLDVPPVLAFTDAAIVSARVDGVFVVVASGRTRGPALERMLALLRNVQAPIRGAIVNLAPRQSDSASEYYQAPKPFSWNAAARMKLRQLRERLVRA